MAKKGQKFNTYTEEFKIKVVEEYVKLVEEWIVFYNTNRIKNRK